MEITVIVNGKKLVDSIEPDLLLIDFLRKHGCYSVKQAVKLQIADYVQSFWTAFLCFPAPCLRQGQMVMRYRH